MPTPQLEPTAEKRYSHAVEELTVGFVPFAFGHQAVQFVDEPGFHLKHTWV